MASQSSCGNLLFGLILTFGSLFLLWWNEGRSVAVYNTLTEAQGAATLTGDGGKLTPGLGGRLVFINGVIKADGQNELVDSQLNVTFTSGIKLKRKTEVYQYQKEEVKENEDLVQYRKVWSEELLPSAEKASRTHKRYKNPDEIKYPSKVIEALTMKVGDFVIESTDLRKQVDWYKKLPLSTDPKLPEPSRTDSVAVNARFKGIVDESALPSPYRIETREHTMVTRKPSAEAAIGDAKITYYGIAEGDVSVLAETTGDGKLRAWTPQSKGKMVTSLAIVERGKLTLSETIRLAVDKNNTVTNVFRIVGVLASCVGWYYTLSPIEIIVSYVPFFGGLASVLVGCGIMTMAVALGLSSSLTVVSLAWLFYRPLFAVPMLFLCFALLFTKLIRPIMLSNKKSKASVNKLNVRPRAQVKSVEVPNDRIRTLHATRT